MGARRVRQPYRKDLGRRVRGLSQGPAAETKALQIEVRHPRELTAERMARWTALQRGAPGLDSPYLSSQWARVVERAQADTADIKVAILVEDGRDVGFLPARVGSYTAMPVGAPMCDYQGLVAEPGLSVDAREIVQALGVHRLDFCHMLADQPSFARHARGLAVSRIVQTGGGYEAYAAERREAGVSMLKDCDKKRRKVGRELGEPRFTAFSRSRADLDQMLAWKSAQFQATGQVDIFATDWTRRLIDETFASRDPDFGGVLFTLHIGDRLAAAQFNLHGRNTVHAWLIAHDPAFERYSPGLLLFQDILRWMDETPYSRLDLGPGDVRFKLELANATQEVAYGFVGLPSAATLIRGAAYGVRRAAESLPLGAVSALPGKAMRRMDRWRGLR